MISMIVLGIDPGLANTGYGVVVNTRGRLAARDGGVIETHAAVAQERRLGDIHAAVDVLLAEHQPDAVALEELYFGQNVRTAFAVGQARGVIMLAAGQRGVPCVSYTPQKVKSAVCGNGRADKQQVARMVQALLALPSTPTSDHASDALAVAICHLNGAPLAHSLARARPSDQTVPNGGARTGPSGRTNPNLPQWGMPSRAVRAGRRGGRG